jgi:hypothetical protein
VERPLALLAGLLLAMLPAQPSAAAPAPRAYHGLVADTCRDRMWLFGGEGVDGTLGDLWWYGDGAWHAVDAEPSPPARSVFGISFDRRRCRLLIAGGRGADGTLADVWEFDGERWREVAPLPRPVFGHSMAYDAGRGVTVVFGGYVGERPKPGRRLTGLVGRSGRMLLEYKGWRWLRPDFAGGPEPRYHAAMAWDPARETLVLVGGVDNFGQDLADTWLWNGRRWSAGPPLPEGGRRLAMLVASPDRRGLVLAGGMATDAVIGDPWILTPAGWSPRRWADVPPLAGARAALHAGGILVFGGQGADGDVSGELRRVTPSAPAGSPQPPRRSASIRSSSGGCDMNNRLKPSPRLPEMPNAATESGSWLGC